MQQSGAFAEEEPVLGFSEDMLLEQMLQETLNPAYEGPEPQTVPVALRREQALHGLRKRATHYALQLQPLLRLWGFPTVRVQLKQRKLLPFAELSGLATGRSYFNLVSIEEPRSLWTMHCSRSLAEGLAQQRLRKRYGSLENSELEDEGAHSAVFLEIGEFLRKARDAMLAGWGGTLAVAGCRPVLRPRFTKEASPSDEYALLSYRVESPEVSGDLHWAIPVSAAVQVLSAAGQEPAEFSGFDWFRNPHPAFKAKSGRN